MMVKNTLFICLVAVFVASAGCLFSPVSASVQNSDHKLLLKLELGHGEQKMAERFVKIYGSSPGLQVSIPVGENTEREDKVSSESVLQCGGGDVDAILAEAAWPEPGAPLRPVSKPGIHMWEHFFTHGSPGQVQRLLDDPWQKPDAPLVTVKLNREGTEGFTIGLEQLINEGAMWLPEQDVYITIAGHPHNFSEHVASLKGRRILHKVQEEPDATLEQFHDLWTDFGNPLVSDPSWNNWQTQWMGTTGHLVVTAPAHGSIYKFAIDRWGNIRPDFASPHKFRLNLEWNNSQWTGQSIENGLPVVKTTRKKNGQKMTTEQFACPLDHPDAAVRGYLPGALLSSVKITGEPGPVAFSVTLNNELKSDSLLLKDAGKNTWAVTGAGDGRIWLMVKTAGGLTLDTGNREKLEHGHQLNLGVSGNLNDEEPAECVIWLPSPPVAPSQVYRLERLNYKAAKDFVVNYWEEWISRGARFEVPDEKINQLFRASLWHSLVLPRHTIGTDNQPHMDIPYANTAYGQQNADWPINQAVYVDYMIYGLRGYEHVAEDELAAMFDSQQWENGRIGGYANWGVYSPGHLYAIAQNYLLSRNNESFERLLPASLKTLDWCLEQMAAADSAGYAGLINAPLNDNSPEEHVWAFTQAYFAGGLNLFAKALGAYGHPRAGEVKDAAARMQQKVTGAFARASVLSPVVQLEDGTWINYVPTDAFTPRRQIDQWYPTDVDTGPLHLSRLGAVPANHWLTTAMLHDHEDNLFIHNRGAANEPVYLPQANVYLLRDNPGAVIRSFYSMMACAFSHNQLTSLEHRWAHPIYYSPPSTDGAWFEIYRKMLLNEVGEDTLFVGQAIPRVWLAQDKKVEVENAPTYFGPVSFTMEGLNKREEIKAEIELTSRNLPKILKVRFRHPESAHMKSVMINGRKWDNFDAGTETITIGRPQAGTLTVEAVY